VISEELDELFEICDRIAVIADGRLSPAKRITDTDVEEIGVWMSGMWPQGESGSRGADAA
jgi:simple sugar transport system ATP-binding protein